MDRTAHITCDACDSVFTLSAVSIEEEKLTENRIGMYFVCPICGVKYPFAAITRRGLDLRDQLSAKRRLLGQEVERVQRRGRADDVSLQVQKQQGQVRELLLEYQKEVTGPYKESEVLQK